MFEHVIIHILLDLLVTIFLSPHLTPSIKFFVTIAKVSTFMKLLAN